MSKNRLSMIETKRYEELLEKEEILYLLEAYGVDNWEGYSRAVNDEEGINDTGNED